MVVAKVPQGELDGLERNGILRFAGIPYAAPPVGDLRWRAPQPADPWSGLRDAKTFGPIAPQQDFMVMLLGLEPEPQDESCLFLNVFTPGADDRRRPVMVWIHGGAFVMGSGSGPGYDGSELARRGDVVVVTINYRLGALGYLHLADVDAAYGDSGNLGVLDQVAALQWVHDNIGALGGDPDNVTIFGESAGGMSVGTLLGTPAAAGLFHKAIPQSGAAHNVSPAAHATEVTQQLLDTLRVTDIGGMKALSPDQIVAGQQSFIMRFFTDTEALINEAPDLRLPFQPVQDDAVLDRRAIDNVSAGTAAGVPVMAGTCREEWKLFQFLDPNDLDEEGLSRRLGKVFADGAQAQRVYQEALQGESPKELFGAAVTDLVFRQPAIRLCEALVQRGSPTYSYLFSWPSPTAGACHALDVPFVFGPAQAGIAFLTGDNPPQSLVDALQESWLAFARTGDPSNDVVGEWPRYDLDRRATMRLDVPTEVVYDPESSRRALWASMV